ncbi:hypothetical protein JYT86_00280 [bacterium AH-315-N03]|nr:hypothetical protein [bacterium AH-315-N03]
MNTRIRAVLRRSGWVSTQICMPKSGIGSVSRRRHLDAKKLARHPGGRAIGYTLACDEVEERRSGTSCSGLSCRFVVRSPSSAALAWMAFDHEADLLAFCDAYGIAIEGELTPGSRFYLRFPEDDSRALPLERRA